MEPQHDISARDFGRLEAEVKALNSKVGDLADEVSELVKLAERSRGGFWVGMAAASVLGSVATWFGKTILFR